ncbi:hypothetical protein O181_011247 [Austropuccinia psidii MF-1]|uniref:Uncharacterized protein n=1 Tax=Austropuccinia psidii MF-1 TaxID=1389203 RepID=A0A9Q3BU53_9BASI|nr:hypothetical protein [Austropuccinia psidii MF-1]
MIATPARAGSLEFIIVAYSIVSKLESPKTFFSKVETVDFPLRKEEKDIAGKHSVTKASTSIHQHKYFKDVLYYFGSHPVQALSRRSPLPAQDPLPNFNSTSPLISTSPTLIQSLTEDAGIRGLVIVGAITFLVMVTIGIRRLFVKPRARCSKKKSNFQESSDGSSFIASHERRFQSFSSETINDYEWIPRKRHNLEMDYSISVSCAKFPSKVAEGIADDHDNEKQRNFPTQNHLGPLRKPSFATSASVTRVTPARTRSKRSGDEDYFGPRSRTNRGLSFNTSSDKLYSSLPRRAGDRC